MHETVDNGAESNIAEIICRTLCFSAICQLCHFFNSMCTLLFLITPAWEIQWSDVRKTWWSRNCRVLRDVSIIKVPLQYFSNICGYVWRSTILHLYYFSNDIFLLQWKNFVILQRCCIPRTCDEARFHASGSDLLVKVRTGNECICDADVCT